MSCNFNKLLLGLVLCGSLASAEELNKYTQEFDLFKKSVEHEVIFNEDSNESLREIQRDIINCSELTFFQRMIRSMCLSLNVVAVNNRTMPLLHNYVDDMCKRNAIATPTVFLTVEKGFFNAFAIKLLVSSGAVVVGQKLLKETTEKEFEAIVAHEIGHIKLNHVNKTIGITFASYIASHFAVEKLCAPIDPFLLNDPVIAGIDSFKKAFLTMIMGDILTAFIINKRFEKEADEFAYKNEGKAEGLIEACKDFERRHNKYDADFANTHAKLKANWSNLGILPYASMKFTYGCAALGQAINKLERWIYYNTPMGAHPSPKARIATIEEYLATTN